MTEFLCGLFIGGNVTFLVAAMILSSRPGKVVKRSGTQITYKNSKGVTSTVELVNDIRSNDTHAVVKRTQTDLEFVISTTSIIE
jgi:hypothetical protein